MKRFDRAYVRACSSVDREFGNYLVWLQANAIKPPINTDGRPWVVMYQGDTADQLRALAASLLIAADKIEDEQAKPKEHCPIRMATGRQLPRHAPCDTGDHSKDQPRGRTWLIESRTSLRWWGYGGWLTDAMAAFHYNTRVAAESAIRGLGVVDAKATEVFV